MLPISFLIFLANNVNIMFNVSIMVKSKYPYPYETPTKAPEVLPILLKVEKGSGQVMFQQGDATGSQAVRPFTPDDLLGSYEDLSETAKKRFRALAQIVALESGKRVDFSLLQKGFRELAEDAFDQQLADLISADAKKDPKQWRHRWEAPLFNLRLKSARLVMWIPDRGPRFQPAIYCEDLETARFASLLLSRIRACIGCGRFFVPERPDKFYHDGKCANAHAARRRRDRRKKASVKPRRKG